MKSADQIRARDVTAQIVNLESYIRKLKADSQERRQLAVTLKKEAEVLQRQRAREISSATSSSQNDAVRGSIIAIEREHAKIQDKKQDAVKVVEDEAAEIERITRDAEDLVRELQRYEQGIRDYELKIHPLYEKADQIMRAA